MALAGAFNNRSLRTKIGAVISAATATGLIVGGVAIYTLRHHNQNAEEMLTRTIAVDSAVGKFSKNVEAFGGAVSAMQLYPMLAKTIQEGMAGNKTAIDEALTTLETELGDDPEGSKTVAKARDDWAAYTEFLTGTVGGAPSTPAEFDAAVQKYNAIYGAVVADEDTLQALATSTAKASLEQAKSEASKAIWTITLLLALGIVGSLLVAFQVAGRIRRAVQGVSDLAEGIADGDLTRRSDVVRLRRGRADG